MNDKLLVTLIVLFLLAGGTLYFAINKSDGPSAPVPPYQYEAHTMGLNVTTPFDVSLGIDAHVPTPRQQVHFWIPGMDPCPGATKSVQYTPHRYPALPGGNISTVIHQGIVPACCNNAPADNDWRLNPPEVAVL
jgi:hypothetical protein